MATIDRKSKAKRAARWAVEGVPFLRRRFFASSDYSLDVDCMEVGDSTGVGGWSGKRTARRQDRSWRDLVESALNGNPRADVQAVLSSVADALPNGGSLLEVGCGSGYFSEILRVLPQTVDYVGLDLSDAMLALARQRYPQRAFLSGSATSTGVSGGSVQVVLDGAALIHIPNWREALAEYRRIASETVILSSLTISEEPETILFSKFAYGSQVVELAYSRAELAQQIKSLGLEVVHVVETLPYDLENHIGVKTTSELWVCR